MLYIMFVSSSTLVKKMKNYCNSKDIDNFDKTHRFVHTKFHQKNAKPV
jgi:hypothetical protein